MKQLTIQEWIKRNKIGDANENCIECKNECGSEDCFDCVPEYDIECPIMELEIRPNYELAKAEDLKKLKTFQAAIRKEGK
jgi:hypothetical protein